MDFQQQDVAAEAEKDSTANLDFAQQQLLDENLAYDQPAEQSADDAPDESANNTPDGPAAAEPKQEHPLKKALATAASAERPVPVLPSAAHPQPTMDYRLFYLNNAAKFALPNGKTDENRLNAAFYQTVRQTGAAVDNVSDAEFTKRLKKAGATYSDEQIQQALSQANKGYGDYERGRFNAFAGTLRNVGLDTRYNRRRGYITVADNVDMRPGEETAKKLNLQPRTHNDAGYTAADQVSQYYDQAQAAEADSNMPFRQTQVESQQARDFYQAGDKQVHVGYQNDQGEHVVSDYTVDKPTLSGDELVTSQFDPRTGQPRLVVWRKDSDPNQIKGQAMNIQSLLPKPAELTVSKIIGDLVPMYGAATNREGSVWTGSNETLNRAGSWVADKLGYDPTHQELETEGMGLGAGLAKGLAAVGATNRKLATDANRILYEGGQALPLGESFSKWSDEHTYDFTGAGAQKATPQQADQLLTQRQRQGYARAAQVAGNVNQDQQQGMFSLAAGIFL